MISDFSFTSPVPKGSVSLSSPSVWSVLCLFMLKSSPELEALYDRSLQLNGSAWRLLTSALTTPIASTACLFEKWSVNVSSVAVLSAHVNL